MSYLYRKRVTITGTTAGAQTNCIMRLVMHRGAGTDALNTCFLNNLCANWPFDITIKNSSDTVLDYWIENYSGNKATFWIEVDYIPASPGVANFYIYFGDSTITTSQSNITNTFPFGDDLEQDTVGDDPSKWTISQGTNSLIKVNDDDLYKKYPTTISENLAAMCFDGSGNLFAGHWTDGTIRYSTDGGISFTTVYTFAVGSGAIRCIFIASNGYIYASRENSQILVRSIDSGVTWATCLTLSDASSTVWHMDEDSAGYLYAGEYSTGDGSETCAYIYKSVDNAANWTTIWNNPDSTRHIHFVKVDPYTDYIYASQDNAGAHKKIIRSVDGGANWTTLGSGDMRWCPTSVAFGSGYRLFGSDNAGEVWAQGIRKTVDDVNFTDVYVPPTTDRDVFWNGGHVRSDGLIIFGSWTQANNERATIIASIDDGATWTILETMATGVGNRGFQYLSNFDLYNNIILSRSTTTDCEKNYYSMITKVMRGVSADATQATAIKAEAFPSQFAVELSAWWAQLTSILPTVYIQNDATDRIAVAAWSDGLIKYHNGTDWISTGISYLVNRQYRIKYVVRLATKRWDLFIDDVQIASSIPFRNDGSTANRMFFASGAAVLGTNYVDNVRYRAYSTPEPAWDGWSGIEIIRRHSYFKFCMKGIDE